MRKLIGCYYVPKGYKHFILAPIYDIMADNKRWVLIARHVEVAHVIEK